MVGQQQIVVDTLLTPSRASVGVAPTVMSELHVTSPGTAVGTIAYMSPEQALLTAPYYPLLPMGLLHGAEKGPAVMLRQSSRSI